MKLLCLSDLHLDQNSTTLGRDLTTEFIDYLNSCQVDAVLISGDFATGYLNAFDLINKIEQAINKPFYFIPGNHDMYHKQHPFWNIYQKFMSHPCCISNKIISLTDDFCLIGDIGWYDMSLSCNLSPMQRAKFDRIWVNEQTSHLPITNEQVTQYFLNKWEKNLKIVSNKKVIFSTHFVPWERYTIYKEGDDEWNYFTGYLGSKHIGQLIDQHSSIEYVLFGHTHKRFGVIKDLEQPTIVCSPLGEVKDWGTRDFLYEIDKSSTVLTI